MCWCLQKIAGKGQEGRPTDFSGQWVDTSLLLLLVCMYSCWLSLDFFNQAFTQDCQEDSSLIELFIEKVAF
eukprot:m.56254 g.56254  ORF g.56254 m.56254 type:complete len:71 (+) comp34580_c0_seq3:847-1059(+)